MSLLQFVRLPEVKQRLLEEFKQPLVECRNPIQVLPKSKNSSLVGTAFDYLLRFWLKRLNPMAEVRTWVAEDAVALLTGRGNALAGSEFDVPMTVKKTARTILKQAKQTYRNYLSDGSMTDEVIRTTVHLGQLDPAYRAGKVDRNLGNVEQVVIDELRELFSLVESGIFEATHFCALNPDFGEASLEVGGADADIVIDDTLIDIKTKQSGRMTAGSFRQLMGYYMLAQIGGINGNRTLEINRLGIYFARYGELLTFPVPKPRISSLPALVNWFRKKMKEVYGESEEDIIGKPYDFKQWLEEEKNAGRIDLRVYRIALDAHEKIHNPSRRHWEASYRWSEFSEVDEEGNPKVPLIFQCNGAYCSRCGAFLAPPELNRGFTSGKIEEILLRHKASCPLDLNANATVTIEQGTFCIKCGAFLASPGTSSHEIMNTLLEHKRICPGSPIV